MSTSQLPPELIDHIVDHFHDSLNNLRSCALVSRAWLASSRFHLFYEISIYPALVRRKDSDGSSSCNKLYDAIQQSPCIALYVRELRFVIDHVDPNLFNDPILPPLLQSFRTLHKLDLNSKIIWNSLTPDLRNSFRSILALPSLVHFEAVGLCFSRLEHFMHLLHPHLKRLAVNIGWERYLITPANLVVDRENEVLVQEQQPCHLTHLILRGHASADWVLGMHSMIDTSNIHTLDVACHSWASQDSTSRLIASLDGSLKHLTIGNDGLLYDLVSSVDLSRNRNLQTLFFVNPLYEDTGSYVDRVLSSLTCPHLQVLEFRMNIIVSVGIDSGWEYWEGVDRILDSPIFRSLRRTTISLHFVFPRLNMDPGEYGRKFVEHLPLLYSRGILTICYA